MYRIGSLIGNGLLTFMDYKKKFNHFFNNNEIIFYHNKYEYGIGLITYSWIPITNHVIWWVINDGNDVRAWNSDVLQDLQRCSSKLDMT